MRWAGRLERASPLHWGLWPGNDAGDVRVHPFLGGWTLRLFPLPLFALLGLLALLLLAGELFQALGGSRCSDGEPPRVLKRPVTCPLDPDLSTLGGPGHPFFGEVTVGRRHVFPGVPC
jgi:hypothetical protein